MSLAARGAAPLEKGEPMRANSLVLGVVVASILWTAPMEAAGREIHLRLKYSGSAMSTQGDTNRDGLKAGLGTVACTSNLGRCTSQGVGEATVGGRATCPNGNPGINLTLIPGTGHGFTRFEPTGDMLFSELSSETVCYDPSTGTQFKSGTDRITGGTGRFAGATGQLQFEGTQWPLYVDADGNGFAAQTGTVTGTITLR
jgi:hypothetical protein